MTLRGLFRAAAVIGTVLAGFVIPWSAAGGAAAAGSGRTLDPATQFYVPQPDHGAITQFAALTSSGDKADAALIRSMIQTPQAVWFTGGTPQGVQQDVKQVVQQAAGKGQVPVLVAYNIPGRDCAQYSAGGAATGDAYKAWIDGFAAGLGSQKAVVLVEPDGLANLPTDCGQPDTYNRIALIAYAANSLLSDPNALVYLDAGHSAWHSVGDMAHRLIEAGVQNVNGFFLDVSNYQYTTNQVFYGTWISDCLTVAGFDPNYDASNNCPNQYWNGGPPTWVGVAMSPYGIWSEGATDPALNTSGIDTRYANMLNGATPTTHFVIDTSRNGQGPNDMSAYAGSPYDQPGSVITTLQAGNWCNPPGSGLGLRPTANTGVPLVDAYLWVKIPGESDGQCDAAGGVRAWDYAVYSAAGWPTTSAAQATFDPLWGLYDPAAGQWFPQMALDLVHHANPPLSQP